MVGCQPEWRPANDAHRRHANPVSISTCVRGDEPARAAARQLAGNAPAPVVAVPPVVAVLPTPTLERGATRPGTHAGTFVAWGTNRHRRHHPECGAHRRNGDSPATDTGAKLLLEFSNDCWVEVKDAEGKVLISSLEARQFIGIAIGTGAVRDYPG